MKDFRFPLAHTALATVTVAGLVALTACSSSNNLDHITSGHLDDTKYVASQKAVPAKTHTKTGTVAKTKKVCVGIGYKKTCTEKKDGTRTVTVTVTDKPGKPGKPAMYCVELDGVGGDVDLNDQWYEVSWKTYSKWQGKDEGTPVDALEFKRELSSCKH